MERRRWAITAVLLAAAMLAGGARQAMGQAEAGAAPPAAEAGAADGSAYVRSGWYAGLGFVYAPSAFALGDAEDALGVPLTANNAFGLDARLGYRVLPRLAVEGNYQFVPGFEVERAGGRTLADLPSHAVTLNGKAFLMTDTFQPYFVGGVGLLHVNADAALAGLSADGTGFAGRVGAGADYYLRPDVVLNLEFSAVLPTGSVSAVRFLPLVFGAQYRF